MYVALGKHYGFAPGVVSGMTLAQQCGYLEDITRKDGSSPGRVKFDNIEDALAYRQQMQALLNE